MQANEMRSVVSFGRVCRLMEGRSAASSLRYFGESKGRMFSEEERAKEAVYIQKMEREKLEKAEKLKKKKAEREKAEKDKSDMKAEEGGSNKS